MKDATDDVLDLLDYAWRRLETRLAGLTNAEWSWCPSPLDPDISIRWRLQHIADMLTEPRNTDWLGTSGVAPNGERLTSATSARKVLAAAYADFRKAASTADLDREIGEAAGDFGTASRRSFVLHVADELIHHGAEAALLRDLYSSRSPTR